MDFTYFIAAVIALLIGFLASIIFVAAKGRSKRRLIAFALIASVAVNFSMLINWAYADEVSAGFLLMDAAFIVAFSFVGCVFGTLPLLSVRRVWRRRSDQTS